MVERLMRGVAAVVVVLVFAGVSVGQELSFEGRDGQGNRVYVDRVGGVWVLTREFGDGRRERIEGERRGGVVVGSFGPALEVRSRSLTSHMAMVSGRDEGEDVVLRGSREVRVRIPREALARLEELEGEELARGVVAQVGRGLVPIEEVEVEEPVVLRDLRESAVVVVEAEEAGGVPLGVPLGLVALLMLGLGVRRRREEEGGDGDEGGVEEQAFAETFYEGVFGEVYEALDSLDLGPVDAERAEAANRREVVALARGEGRVTEEQARRFRRGLVEKVLGREALERAEVVEGRVDRLGRAVGEVLEAGEALEDVERLVVAARSFRALGGELRRAGAGIEVEGGSPVTAYRRRFAKGYAERAGRLLERTGEEVARSEGRVEALVREKRRLEEALRSGGMSPEEVVGRLRALVERASPELERIRGKVKLAAEAGRKDFERERDKTIFRRQANGRLLVGDGSYGVDDGNVYANQLLDPDELVAATGWKRSLVSFKQKALAGVYTGFSEVFVGYNADNDIRRFNRGEITGEQLVEGGKAAAYSQGAKAVLTLGILSVARGALSSGRLVERAAVGAAVGTVRGGVNVFLDALVADARGERLSAGQVFQSLATPIVLGGAAPVVDRVLSKGVEGLTGRRLEEGGKRLVSRVRVEAQRYRRRVEVPDLGLRLGEGERAPEPVLEP